LRQRKLKPNLLSLVQLVELKIKSFQNILIKKLRIKTEENNLMILTPND